MKSYIYRETEVLAQSSTHRKHQVFFEPKKYNTYRKIKPIPTVLDADHSSHEREVGTRPKKMNTAAGSSASQNVVCAVRIFHLFADSNMAIKGACNVKMWSLELAGAFQLQLIPKTVAWWSSYCIRLRFCFRHRKRTWANAYVNFLGSLANLTILDLIML